VPVDLTAALCVSRGWSFPSSRLPAQTSLRRYDKSGRTPKPLIRATTDVSAPRHCCYLTGNKGRQLHEASASQRFVVALPLQINPSAFWSDPVPVCTWGLHYP